MQAYADNLQGYSEEELISELVQNARAGINAFGQNVEQYQETVRETYDRARENAVGQDANGVRETRGPSYSNAPLQQNIDNAVNDVYNKKKGVTEDGVQEGITGRSNEEDRGGVSGVYQGRDGNDSSKAGSERASVNSGLFLLSEESQNVLKKRGNVAETFNVSDNSAAFSMALDEARRSNAGVKGEESKRIGPTDTHRHLRFKNREELHDYFGGESEWDQVKAGFLTRL